jgi:hypothetical protein
MLRLFLKSFRAALFLFAVGLIGFDPFGPPDGPIAARAQPKAPKRLGKYEIPPPPDDVNDLNMEVAALRALYLLKVGPDQVHNGLRLGREAAMPARQREKVEVSPKYRQLLLDLRSAFIAGQEEEIEELSEQLEELTKKEEPDFDDEIEVTQKAREQAPRWLGYFDSKPLVQYLAAYGKDFPSPRRLLVQTLRLDGKSKKPSPEEWKEIRAHVIREVSWMRGGINPVKGKTKETAEAVAKILDRGYALSDEELKDPKAKASLMGDIKTWTFMAPTDIIEHVIEQDLAELMSNPRFVRAAQARERYLAKEAKEAKK